MVLKRGVGGLGLCTSGAEPGEGATGGRQTRGQRARGDWFRGRARCGSDRRTPDEGLVGSHVIERCPVGAGHDTKAGATKGRPPKGKPSAGKGEQKRRTRKGSGELKGKPSAGKGEQKRRTRKGSGELRRKTAGGRLLAKKSGGMKRNAE